MPEDEEEVMSDDIVDFGGDDFEDDDLGLGEDLIDELGMGMDSHEIE